MAAESSQIDPEAGQPKAPRICAVLIAYRPAPQVLDHVRLVLRQVACVVVVDNTAESDSQAHRDLQGLDRCVLIRNHRNLGIAAALNIGIRQAISAGFSWIVAFDQDSQISEGYIPGMLRAYRDAARQVRVGMVCPLYKEVRLGAILPTHRGKSGEILDCMTSGSMLRAETFLALGPMEERLFIDYVDYEYCLRMRAAGWKIVEAPDAILLHSLGRMRFHRFLGRQVSATHHSPARRYYIHRNRLVLIGRYAFKDPEWAFREFKGWAMDSLKVLILERSKRKKAWYMTRGLYDAIAGRLGPRVEL